MNFLNGLETVENIKLFKTGAIYLIVLFTFSIFRFNKAKFTNRKENWFFNSRN